MKSWLKNASLVVTIIHHMAFKASKCARADKQNLMIDFLPSTIIQPEVDNEVSKIMNGNTSGLNINAHDLLSKLTKNKVLEIAKYFSDPDYFYDTRGLPNINFKDLKFAVVDIRNIDYLKQDF